MPPPSRPARPGLGPRRSTVGHWRQPLVAALALTASWGGVSHLSAQTRPAPVADTGLGSAGRPIPGPVYESTAFSRAVARGTRTRTGMPGPGNWVQHARYSIRATLDVVRDRVNGEETVVYANRSPDSLRQIAVHLRQNVFAP